MAAFADVLFPPKVTGFMVLSDASMPKTAVQLAAGPTQVTKQAA
jgi:hypothetical protein